MGYIANSFRAMALRIGRANWLRTVACDNAAETITIPRQSVMFAIVPRFAAGTIFRVGTSLNGQELLADTNLAANTLELFNLSLPTVANAETVIYFGGCVPGGTIDVYVF